MLGAFMLALFLVYCSAPEYSQQTAGDKIVTANGPEDMEIDSSTGTTRLIISADDRRTKPRPGGVIQYVLLGDTVVHTFRFAHGPGSRLFPHGLALARLHDSTWLYVISHEPLEEDTTNFNRHRIHRFYVTRDTLYWIEALENPLLRAPNDLYVTPDGQIFVTNYLKRISAWQTMSTALFKRRTGSTVRYRPGQGWDEIISRQVYPNGIYLWQNKLFVAEGGRKRIQVYTLGSFSKPLHQMTDRELLFADNFSLGSDGMLYLTSHPCMFCFSAHARQATKLSPSLGWRINPENYHLEKIFSDDGSNVSAASTLVKYQQKYVLSQVFNPYLLSVPATH